MLNDPFLAILVNHLWQSSLFALAIWALALLLRKNRARARYALWLAASLKFLVPFGLLAAVGALLPWHPEVSGTGTAPAILKVAGDITVPLVAEMPYPQIASAGAVPVDVLVPLIALVVWLIGAVLVATRWLVRWLEIRRALRQSVLLPDLDFPAPVHATQQNLEPGMVGIFRPRLLLPAGIEERLTAEQMRAVLAHERCHLQRRDNFTAALHMLVETLFWFFPPVWWIGARLIEEREKACDEQVVQDGHAPRSYAEGILNVCEHYIASRLPCVSGVSGSDLRKRVELIVRRTLGVKLDAPRKMALAAVLFCSVAAPITAGMLSGNVLQAVFSLGPETAAMTQYWQVLNSRAEHMGNTRLCLTPDTRTIDRQKALATLLAKLPPKHDKALLYAVAANSRTDVQRLLDAGAPRGGDGFLTSDSLIHIAAQLADAQMLSLLVNQGFNMEERSLAGIGRRGYTPLMTALSAGQLDNARWLIEHTANVNATDQHDYTPLLLAMLPCRSEETVALLLRAGARPNARALRVAASTGMDLGANAATPGPPLKDWREPPDARGMILNLDGDGKPDLAAVFRSLDGRRDGLFVRLSSRNPDQWIRVAVSRDSRDTHAEPLMAASRAAPGTYERACARGLGKGKSCPPGEPSAVEVKHEGIHFYTPESAGSIVFWDDVAQEFQQVWTSD